MVPTSVGRYLKKTLTNIICIFTKRPFHARHFLWHTSYAKYSDPSRANNRSIFYKMAGARLGDLGTNPDLGRMQARDETSALYRLEMPTLTRTPVVACKPSKLYVRAGQWQQPPPLPTLAAAEVLAAATTAPCCHRLHPTLSPRHGSFRSISWHWSRKHMVLVSLYIGRV